MNSEPVVGAVRSPPGSGIRRIVDRAAALARAGHDLLHLEIGRPDWHRPPGVDAETQRAIDRGFVHYVDNRGLLELRESVATFLQAATGYRCQADQELVMTSGASEGLAMVGLALLGAGDEVILPEPAWPHYRVVAELCGARVVSIPLQPENGFQLSPEEVAARLTARTKLVVLNSPSNPTGAVQSEACLREVAALSEKHGFYLLSDEVYQDFVYQGAFTSLLSLMGGSDRLILLNSFSKSYAMTGWRVGYVVATAPVAHLLNRVHQHLTVCGVSFAQKGAAAVLGDPGRLLYLQEMRQAFLQRYAVWRDALSRCPALVAGEIQGAFYLFPRLRFRGMTGAEFCDFMLEKHHVAMVPGEVFGPDYAQYIRISYGRDLETQQRATTRLLEVLNG